MKIIVVTPSFQLLGGVANHYLGLKAYWNCDVHYEFYGKRKSVPAPITFGFDLIKFTFKLIVKRPDAVIINPSLRKYQLFRDGLYLKIASFFNIPVVTFIHGWSDEYAEALKKNGFRFRRTYNQSKLLFVLAQEFKQKLIEIGIHAPIELTTTKVNNALLNNFTIESRTGHIQEILFLARIVEEKGIFITIHAFALLQQEFPHLVLRIVGGGPDLEKSKALVSQLGLKNVLFRGPVFGEAIAQEFKAAQLYIMPSYHGEGMPTSVLEAMAFGMPIITRPLGGLKDFFDVPKMGVLIESFEPTVYADAIKQFITHPTDCKEIAHFNHNYATKHFTASQVAENIEKEIQQLIHSTQKNDQR